MCTFTCSLFNKVTYNKEIRIFGHYVSHSYINNMILSSSNPTQNERRCTYCSQAIQPHSHSGRDTWGYSCMDDEGMVTQYGHIVHWTYTRDEDSVYVFDVLFCPEIKTIYIIDICEVSGMQLLPPERNPSSILDGIEQFFVNDIYASEVLEDIKVPVLRMYPAYNAIQFYNDSIFKHTVESYIRRLMFVQRMVFRNILHESICHRISQLSLPSWCFFARDRYQSSQHMAWARSEVHHLLYKVYDTCQTLTQHCSKTNVKTNIKYDSVHKDFMYDVIIDPCMLYRV